MWLANSAQWQSYHIPLGTGSVLLAPPYSHSFSPSNATKSTASMREEGTAARLAGRDRAGWDLGDCLVLNVRRRVPFHNIRLSPGHLSKMTHATVLWVDKTSKGGPGERQVSEGVKNLPSLQTSGPRWKPQGYHHRADSGTHEYHRDLTPKKLRQNSPTWGGLQRHSPFTGGAVVLASFPESVRRPRVAGFFLALWRVFHGGRGWEKHGGRARRAWPLRPLIRSSRAHSVPCWEGSCPGCHRGAPAWPLGWGCCWWTAAGWPTAGQPLSAHEPSCAGRPRWPCGSSGSRRWGGRKVPWGRGHSTSTGGPLEEGKTTGCHHCPHSSLSDLGLGARG